MTTVPYASPILIEPDRAGVRLERIKLSGTDDNQFSERWLQRLLFDHPESLPMRDIDPAIGHLVPICMELETGAGPADILYLTPLGKIVLVETKLYRNPEARRAVIAQILDYARAVTSWGYETFDRAVRAASRHDERSVSERMQAAADRLQVPFDEALFVNAITRALARADVHLIIVGDGITESTQSLVGFLEQHGSLHFSFALIEAAVYRTPSMGYLLQARILARTEVVRRVLLVDRNGDAVAESTPDTFDDKSNEDPAAAWFTSFWSDYLARLRSGLDDLMQPLPAAPGKSTNIFLPLPPGRSQCWISAYVSKSRQETGVYFAMGSAYERAAEIMDALALEKNDLEAEIGTTLQWGAAWTPYYIGFSLTYTSLDEAAERERVLGALVAITNRFVNAFRPRMEKLGKSDLA